MLPNDVDDIDGDGVGDWVEDEAMADVAVAAVVAVVAVVAAVAATFHSAGEGRDEASSSDLSEPELFQPESTRVVDFLASTR